MNVAPTESRPSPEGVRIPNRRAVASRDVFSERSLTMCDAVSADVVWLCRMVFKHGSLVWKSAASRFFLGN